MSRRGLAGATLAAGPGRYRVSWVFDVEAADHESAALAARTAQLAKGPAVFDVERMPDARQGAFLFGIGARRVEVDAAAVSGAGAIAKAAKAARTPAAAGGKVQPGAAFADALGVAFRAVVADLGPRWHKQPGARLVCGLAREARSYKTERGTVIRNPACMGVPAARFWPGGALPAVLSVLDFARSGPATANEVRRCEVAEWESRAGSAISARDSARQDWLNRVERVCRHGDRFASRSDFDRGRMREAAAEYWQARRAISALPGRPRQLRAAEREIVAGEVLCPAGTKTPAYEAFLSAWKLSPAARPSAAEAAAAAWLRAQCVPEAFRYDAADPAACFRAAAEHAAARQIKQRAKARGLRGKAYARDTRREAILAAWEARATARDCRARAAMWEAA